MITTNSTLSYERQTVPPIIPAVQGDTGRSISFNINDTTIPEGATATFYIQKPSGNAIYNTAEIISSNQILVPLDAQCLAEVGENFGQVRILLNGDVVTSFDFILLVKVFHGIDAIESLTEMNVFDHAVADAVGDIQTEAEQIAAEVIESIPEDYTELTEDVNQLKADLSETNERLSDDEDIIGNYGETFKNVSYFPRINDLFSADGNTLTLERNTNGSNWVTASFPVSTQHKYIILVESDHALEVCSYKFTDSNATGSGDINGQSFSERATVDSTTYNFLRLFFQITSATSDTTITIHVLDITDTIAEVLSGITPILQPVNLIDISKATDGYYVNYSTGSLSSNANFLSSDFIPVEPNNYYTLSVYTVSYGVGQMAWYDDKKQYISGLANSGINTSITVKAPATARYLRWSINKAIKDSTQLQSGKLSTPYTNTEYKIPSKYLPEEQQYVTVGTGGSYRSILEALKDTDDNIKVKVMYGTYDLAQEYTNYYGADFWTNYTGYVGSDDPFLRGLWISNGREIEFDQRAIVTFLPNVENANIASYFCPFAIGYNAKITGLTLKYSGCRYAVHDDFATAPGKNEYVNCRFDGNPSSGAVIGAGCGSNNTYIVDGCVFLNNNGTYDISYHNGSGSYNKNLIVVKNCYGTKKCAFRWYGNSELITDCIVSACKFGSIECVAHSYTPNDKENMKLYSFCNEVSN